MKRRRGVELEAQGDTTGNRTFSGAVKPVVAAFVVAADQLSGEMARCAGTVLA